MSIEGTEALSLNALVAEGSRQKVQENFFLPVEVKEVIDPLIERHGRKQKWMFYVAAILALLEKGDAGIGERIGQVAHARHTGGLGKLIKAATAERWRISQGGIDALTQPQNEGGRPNGTPHGGPGESPKPGKRKGPKG